jgi:hypothetical protein
LFKDTDERRDTQKHVDKMILRRGFFGGFTRVMETPTDEVEKSEVGNVGGSLALLKHFGYHAGRLQWV